MRATTARSSGWGVAPLDILLKFNKLHFILVAVLLAAGTAGCDSSATDTDATVIARNTADPLASALVTPVHVRVQRVSAADIRRQATAVGVVEAFRTSTVAAETSGRVLSRLVEPGDAIGAGQVLVTLDNERALIARDQANARLRSREIDLPQAQNELQRGQNLQEQDFISEDSLESLGFAAARARSALAAARADLAAARRTLSDTEIRAPFAGIADRVHVHEGDYLKSGTPVTALADFSKVRIQAGVTAREAGLLRGAARAEVSLDALGAEPLTGSIKSIARVSDASTGTYTLEIWLENMAAELRNRLREGMLATVYLPSGNDTASLTVPSVAVFRRGGAMHVFTVNSSQAALTPVRTGRTNGPTVEVLQGLTEGDLVVVDGQFALRDGAAVVVED